MITFTNRTPDEMCLPFAEGPVKSTRFFFNKMGQNFTGTTTYEWWSVYGKRHLVIHSIIFDNILTEDVQNLIDPLFYNYLVECAKQSSNFISYRKFSA